MEKNKDIFAEFAGKLKAEEEEAKTRRKETIKSGLMERRKKLKKISNLKLQERIEFLKGEGGLDPYLEVGETISSPRFNRGGFLEKLKLQILRIIQQELNRKYQAISLKLLTEYFKETRSNWKLREGDIEEAIRSLVEEGYIPPTIGDGEKKLLLFSPIELSSDIKQLLETATGVGELTFREIVATTGWTEERVLRAVDYLEKIGLLVKVDEYIVFPSLS